MIINKNEQPLGLAPMCLRHFNIILLSLLVYSFIPSNAAQAATEKLLTIEARYKQSDCVIVVSVEGQTSRWSRGRIITEHSVRPVEALKQNCPTSPFKLTMLGGIVGGIGQVVPGVPKLKRKNHYLIYLDLHASIGWVPIGIRQGILSMSPPTNSSLISDYIVNESENRQASLTFNKYRKKLQTIANRQD
ncbi:MAG: hypothetical protein VYA34_03255 [Myxococcota bacterium]|nr:hypothetical protein [Myxococcota bacterium]